MIRSSRAAGFVGRSVPVASISLTQAVAASLAFGAISLGLIAMATIRLAMAMPFPA